MGSPFYSAITAGLIAVILHLGESSACAQIRFQLPDEAFTQSAFWKESVFEDEFLPKEPATIIALRAWSERPDVFGAPTHGVWARFIDGKMISMTVLFLDSGTHFGYVPRSSAAETELQHHERFKVLFTKTKIRVEKGLKALSGHKKPLAVTLGDSPMLSQDVLIFPTGDLFARYHKVDEQLLKVVWFRSLEEAKSWTSIKDQPEIPESVPGRENGDVILENLPLLLQGDRAYCGVSALAMTMQYLGLNAETEDYAAAAGIRYGSTKGSYIQEVYDAAADEAGYRLRGAPTVNGAAIAQSIDAGIPVLVWRKWNHQRDFLHSAFQKKFQVEPDLILPYADDADRQSWPTERNGNHASVITGYNKERGEVIFSESWSESVRNRRMRLEEMIGTTYEAFYFEPIDPEHSNGFRPNATQGPPQ